MVVVAVLSLLAVAAAGVRAALWGEATNAQMHKILLDSRGYACDSVLSNRRRVRRGGRPAPRQGSCRHGLQLDKDHFAYKGEMLHRNQLTYYQTHAQRHPLLGNNLMSHRPVRAVTHGWFVAAGVAARRA